MTRNFLPLTVEERPPDRRQIRERSPKHVSTHGVIAEREALRPSSGLNPTLGAHARRRR
jgi:hypothetical protein